MREDIEETVEDTPIKEDDIKAGAFAGPDEIDEEEIDEDMAPVTSGITWSQKLCALVGHIFWVMDRDGLPETATQEFSDEFTTWQAKGTAEGVKVLQLPNTSARTHYDNKLKSRKANMTVMERQLKEFETQVEEGLWIDKASRESEMKRIQKIIAQIEDDIDRLESKLASFGDPEFERYEALVETLPAPEEL